MAEHSQLYDYYVVGDSPEWQERKRRYALKHEKRCKACLTRYSVTLHHRRYDNLGHEPDRDLRWMCVKHHNLLHQIEKLTPLNIAQATWLVILSIRAIGRLHP